MKIDARLYISLLSKEIVKEECNYKALLSCIEDDEKYLISSNYIIPKNNIDYIKIEKIVEESEEN